MALSQLQCLDDNHVNPRTNEAKPDFLYCEDQRLALEALLRDGREAFFKFLEARGLRGFLSDPELDALFATAEPYDPGTELFPEDAEEGDPPLSLHYWPELSDTSVPEMDLGWPDCESYRGVTRTTIYSQPPLEGQVHVKEIVRKMIAQAQKVRRGGPLNGLALTLTFSNEVQGHKLSYCQHDFFSSCSTEPT